MQAYSAKTATRAIRTMTAAIADALWAREVCLCVEYLTSGTHQSPPPSARYTAWRRNDISAYTAARWGMHYAGIACSVDPTKGTNP